MHRTQKLKEHCALGQRIGCATSLAPSGSKQIKQDEAALLGEEALVVVGVDRGSGGGGLETL